MSFQNGKTAELFNICSQVVHGSTAVGDGISQIRSNVLESDENQCSTLYDIISVLSAASLDAERKKKATEFFNAIADEFLPRDVLRLDIPQLATEDVRSKIVKAKTKIYYKQLKFNLFREENEGYSKIICELLTVENNNATLIFQRISQLIGQFNLDPNRIVDLVLDAFSCNVEQSSFYVDLIKLFHLEDDLLRRIILLKFVFFKRAGSTPNAFYKVVAILGVAQMIDLRTIHTVIHPPKDELVEDFKSRRTVISDRVAKAETVSTLSVIETENENNGNTLNGVLSEGPSTSNVQSRSFETIIRAQEIEDQRIAGDAFDEELILTKNQKLGLLVGCAEVGALTLVAQLVPLFPDGYALAVSPRFAKALCEILEHIIEPFFIMKCPSIWPDKSRGLLNRSQPFFEPPIQMSKWSELKTKVLPVAKLLGPYIGVDRNVGVKLMRLLGALYEDKKAQADKNYKDFLIVLYNIVDYSLLPSCSVGEPTFAYADELWNIMSRIPYETRYWMYGRWKGTHQTDCCALVVQRGKVTGRMKYLMKRIAKETIKMVGRQFGKVTLIHPTVAFDFLLDRVQTFQNLTSPVVESMRYLSDLAFDVLSYSLIESLSSPSKQGLKTSDGTLSAWLIALANFAGAICRRYTIEYEGLLQYITNQLKDGKSVDLMVLREVITQTAGFEPSNSLTNDQVDALCAGEILRQEVMNAFYQKGKKSAIVRLRDALLRTNLCEALMILMAQQKSCVVFVETKDAPPKLASQMIDECQEAFLQYVNFIRSNIKHDEYMKRVPSVATLLHDYSVPIESAFYLARPNYFNRALSAFELTKRFHKETSDEPKRKVDAETKDKLYKEAFQKMFEAVEEEMLQNKPDTFWTPVSVKAYTMFWLLQASDLEVSRSLYDREIERLRREAKEADLRNRRRDDEHQKSEKSEQKLISELARQEDHVSRIRALMETTKGSLFAPGISGQLANRFLYQCVLPRCVYGEIDAVFCARFIFRLHSISTPNFNTMSVFDRIITETTPIIMALSENEVAAFGRFLCLILEQLHKWHSKKEIYDAECEGKPGTHSKTKNGSPFTFEHYRQLCFMWHKRLAAAIVHCLDEKSSYTLTRNGFILLTKIINQFPIITDHVKEIEAAATAVKDREKSNRMDLNGMAQSFLVLMKKRNVRVYEVIQFYRPGAARVTVAAPPASNGSSAASTPPARKRVAATELNGSSETAAKHRRDRLPERNGDRNERIERSERSERMR